MVTVLGQSSSRQPSNSKLPLFGFLKTFKPGKGTIAGRLNENKDDDDVISIKFLAFLKVK